jgi:hypothetical protein
MVLPFKAEKTETLLSTADARIERSSGANVIMTKPSLDVIV